MPLKSHSKHLLTLCILLTVETSFAASLEEVHKIAQVGIKQYDTVRKDEASDWKENGLERAKARIPNLDEWSENVRAQLREALLSSKSSNKRYYVGLSNSYYTPRFTVFKESEKRRITMTFHGLRGIIYSPFSIVECTEKWTTDHHYKTFYVYSDAYYGSLNEFDNGYDDADLSIQNSSALTDKEEEVLSAFIEEYIATILELPIDGADLWSSSGRSGVDPLATLQISTLGHKAIESISLLPETD